MARECQAETLGTLTIHKNAVFLWSILAAVVLSLLFAVFFRKSYQTPKRGVVSLQPALLSLILIVPVFAVTADMHGACVL